MNREYTRGQKVWWWSEESGRSKATKAVYLRDDKDFPAEDVILVIPIGKLKHRFRWPRRFTEPLIV